MHVHQYHLKRCALQRVRWPLDLSAWMTLGCPATRSHIVLSEADAALWALEDRLHRPGDSDCRCLQGGDSAAPVGAFNKAVAHRIC